MLNRDEVYNKIASIVAEKLSIEKATIKPASTLQDLGADSLDLVEIIMKIEEIFHIEISDDEVAHLNNIDQVVDYVISKSKQ